MSAARDKLNTRAQETKTWLGCVCSHEVQGMMGNIVHVYMDISENMKINTFYNLSKKKKSV